MDIALDKNGDLYVSDKGDIELIDSVMQKIMIKLQWFLEEWQYDPEEGIPYLDIMFEKNPDIEDLEDNIREKIFEVDEITEVEYVNVTMDTITRTIKIEFEAETDLEVYRREVLINCRIME